MLFEIAIGLIVLLALVLLRPLWFMNGAASFQSGTRIRNLTYDLDPRHKSDLYLPRVIDSNKPIVVFVHGGAWDAGHKNDYAFAGKAFSEMGYITQIPNYRLYPQAKYPQFIQDVATAIRALPSQLRQSGIEVENSLNIVLVGHSAGAHTVAMLATQPDYLKNVPVEIKSVIGLAGPYDLPLDDPLVVGKFDGVELYEHKDLGHEHNQHEANPINLATSEAPPMLLIHGDKDVTVGPYHTQRFSERLTEIGVKHEVITYSHVDHRQLVGGLAKIFRFLNPVFKDIRACLELLSDR
jgi:acetyl esterase/lipase